MGMDVITNDNNHTMESVHVGVDIVTNDDNYIMESMVMVMDIIHNNNDGYGMMNDDNDNFSNDDNCFTPTTTPMNGIACNELLFLHCNYLCHHNFNIPPQSRPNIYNYLFYHSSCIHWL